MTPLKINNLPFLIPDSWDDVTIDAFLRIREYEEKGDITPMGIVSVLTGVDVKFLNNVSQSDGNQLLAHIGWYVEPVNWDKLEAPSHIQIEEERYKIPYDLESMSWGQIELMKKVTADRAKEVAGTPNEMNGMLTTIPKILAIVLQPVIDGGKFDIERLEAIEPMMGALPAVTAYPVGSFFLRNCISRLLSGASDYTELQKQKKRQQGSKGLMSLVT